MTQVGADYTIHLNGVKITYHRLDWHEVRLLVNQLLTVCPDALAPSDYDLRMQEKQRQLQTEQEWRESVRRFTRSRLYTGL